METTDLGTRTDNDVIFEYLSVADTFLIDAGCGDMHLSKTLAKHGASVLAIDPDPIQAEINRNAPTIANVGFAETGADQIPAEDHSVDGVLFPYSFHHIPSELHKTVIDEVLRILVPGGFAYILEPVAQGDLNEVMELFHDERAVRAAVQTLIREYVITRFETAQALSYTQQVQFESWDHFASQYALKSYNTHYNEADVQNEAVQRLFEQHAATNGLNFSAPMLVTLLRNPLV